MVLSTQPATPALVRMLKTRDFRNRVVYIQGSALEEGDLKRARVQGASACFVVSDRSKNTVMEDAVEEDHRNVLRVWSIKKFTP